MYSSFIVGTPSKNMSISTTSAIYGVWNILRNRGKEIKIQVIGTPLGIDIMFFNQYHHLGRIEDYVANHLFTYYKGRFDEVYVITETGYLVVVRIKNNIFQVRYSHYQPFTARKKIELFILELTKGLIKNLWINILKSYNRSN